MNKINIKDVKKNQIVLFDKHTHYVLRDQLDCTDLEGRVMSQYPCITINLFNRKHQEELSFFDTGKGKNNLIFNFPDDEDMYDDVQVTIINAKVEDDTIEEGEMDFVEGGL